MQDALICEHAGEDGFSFRAFGMSQRKAIEPLRPAGVKVALQPDGVESGFRI